MSSANRSLIDAHVHLSGRAALDSISAAGIAAVRHAGMIASAEFRGAAPARKRPRVVSSCWALFKYGGYGSRFGVPISGPEEVPEQLRRLKGAGADIIKVMGSGIVSLKHPGTVTEGGFNADELRTIVGEAAALGLGVMAHANGEISVVSAVQAGVRSIEHGFFMTPSALGLMADRGTFWTPTIGALVRAAESSGVSASARDFISRVVKDHLRMVRQAHSIGVPLAVGTDCVLPDPGYEKAYQDEIGYFEQAGIPREEVLRIATENGAVLLGLANRESQKID